MAWFPVWCVCVVWGSTGVLFFWIAPVAFTTRGRGLTFNFARIPVRAPIHEPCFQPTNTEGPHNAVKSVLSCPMYPIATACVSSPKEWALLIGSHMQQEVVISFGASTPVSAPVLMWTVHQQKCKTRFATTSRRETMFAARDSTHISRTPGRSQRASARLNSRSVNWR